MQGRGALSVNLYSPAVILNSRFSCQSVGDMLTTSKIGRKKYSNIFFTQFSTEPGAVHHDAFSSQYVLN